MSASVVLITGAAKRMGREITLAFARAGWDIAVHYGHSAAEARQTVADASALGRKAVALQADLSDEAQVLALSNAAYQTFGRLDAVINNAALFEHDIAANFSQASFFRHAAPNLVAPILLARELYRLIPDGRQGVVINLLDQKLYHYNPDFLSYSLTKAALQAATIMLAQALAPKVRVVGIAPGLTLPSHLQDTAAFDRTQALSLTGKSGTTSDVAAAVLFAVNNGSMTGSTVLVDGGQHLLGLDRDVSFL
jgi:NAD(P)-dependent dehydrogenase (short-subunit alcohol dehydrogenase family)